MTVNEAGFIGSHAINTVIEPFVMTASIVT